MRFAYAPIMCPPEQYIPLAKAAEELGFDGLTMPDSICYPKDADTKYPYNADGSRNFLEGVPFIEPFIAIPAMAAVTEKLRFTTSVYKLAIRNPVITAKQLTSLAVMTNNRFAFGVGLSPWKEDFEICDAQWEKRGKRMDQMIEIIRGLSTGDYFGYDSEFYQIPESKLCPVPSQEVPMLIGGHAPLALKRAARIGDGWVHAGGSIDTLKPLIDEINGYRKEFGTDNKDFEVHAITADAYSADGVKRLEEIGVTECIIGFRDAYAGQPDDKTVEEKIGMMRWFADNIIAKS